jgi:hypothetical protein
MTSATGGTTVVVHYTAGRWHRVAAPADLGTLAAIPGTTFGVGLRIGRHCRVQPLRRSFVLGCASSAPGGAVPGLRRLASSGLLHFGGEVAFQ